jgi:hypothetical protein
MTTDAQKITEIKKLIKKTRKALDEACKNDSEYNTSTGNGVCSSEASQFFKEIEHEIGKILG